MRAVLILRWLSEIAALGTLRDMSNRHHHASHAVKKPTGFPEVLPPVVRSGVELDEGAWKVWVLSAVSGWLTCPHNHRTEQAARRCQMAWNDYAHDERERIMKEGNGVF